MFWTPARSSLAARPTTLNRLAGPHLGSLRYPLCVAHRSFYPLDVHIPSTFFYIVALFSNAFGDQFGEDLTIWTLSFGVSPIKPLSWRRASVHKTKSVVRQWWQTEGTPDPARSHPERSAAALQLGYVPSFCAICDISGVMILFGCRTVPNEGIYLRV